MNAYSTSCLQGKMPMFSDDSIVPVVMFHSVGLADTDWVFSHISEPVSCFEDKIVALLNAGYSFLFWEELHQHMTGSHRAPQKSIMLTFDDGYLDNWTYVFPLLKKYGIKATIFVNPEFVDPSSLPRLTADDVAAGRASATELQAKGFLNWAEMRAMEASGLVDIQSHALTHTWYASGPIPVDFHSPGCRKYPWCAWNLRPERKAFYMIEDQSDFLPLGTPVYQHAKALVCKKYFPPEGISTSLAEFVRANGGPDFFTRKDWFEELHRRHTALMTAHGHRERWESEQEYGQRVLHELVQSREIIGAQLKKDVRYICWPGGGYNETVLPLARKAGYRAWTLASRDCGTFRNRYASGGEQIRRVGCFSHYTFPGKPPLGRANWRFFYSGIERHKGSALHTWLGRAQQAGALFRYQIGRMR